MTLAERAVEKRITRPLIPDQRLITNYLRSQLEVLKSNNGIPKLDSIQDYLRTLDESFLLQNMLGAPVSHVVPEGLIAVPILGSPDRAIKHLKVGYFAPHPGDHPDFLGGTSALLKNVEITEFLITAGEQGGSPLYPNLNEAREKRLEEAEEAAKILKTKLKPVQYTDENGQTRMLSDGELLLPLNLQRLTAVAKTILIESKLDIIFMPAAEADHPDHVAVNYAVVTALQQLRDEGYFKDDKLPLPALYATIPEYGYDWGLQFDWAKQPIEQYLIRFGYQTLDQRDQPLYPGSEFPFIKSPISARNQKRIRHQFVIPHFIFNIDATFPLKMKALFANETQVVPEKSYAENIPIVANLFGRVINSMSGEAFRQVIIPGATSDENIIINNLPQGVAYKLEELLTSENGNGILRRSRYN